MMGLTFSIRGKRVLIAPFDMDEKNPTENDLCMLARIKRHLREN